VGKGPLKKGENRYEPKQGKKRRVSKRAIHHQGPLKGYIIKKKHTGAIWGVQFFTYREKLGKGMFPPEKKAGWVGLGSLKKLHSDLRRKR